MVRRLIKKLSADRRSRLVIEVRETNLGAQLFFREMGLLVKSTNRNRYEGVCDDAYQFEYHYDWRKRNGRNQRNDA